MAIKIKHKKNVKSCTLDVIIRDKDTLWVKYDMMPQKILQYKQKTIYQNARRTYISNLKWTQHKEYAVNKVNKNFNILTRTI